MRRKEKVGKGEERKEREVTGRKERERLLGYSIHTLTMNNCYL